MKGDYKVGRFLIPSYIDCVGENGAKISLPISDLSPEELSGACKKFRESIFQRAGLKDPFIKVTKKDKEEAA